MIYSTFRGRLSWSWMKNAPDLGALLTRRYPRFVWRDVESLEGVIPVFTFHSVEPDTFETCCRILAEGGYRTLHPDEFLAILEGRHRAPRRSVLLTFDDGGGSLWSVAYPLLRRYGLKGTAFVVSGLIEEGATRLPNLDDVWTGRIPLKDVLSRERGPNPLCTWDELRSMQNSGVVEVQSHTHTHALVHVGPRIRDFLNPRTDPYLLGNFNVPMVRENGIDQIERPVVYGRPVYEALPRMEGRPRYFDDERVRIHCERYVADRGGGDFFRRRGWRRELRAEARRSRKALGDTGCYAAVEKALSAVREELWLSRTVLEQNLCNKVEHLCYPWYRGSRIAVAVAKEVGYRTNFWGILLRWKSSGPVGDPFRIQRLDGRYIARLPGPLREPLGAILRKHFWDQGPSSPKE